MNQRAKQKITDIQQVPFTAMGISEEASVWHIRTQLSAIALADAAKAHGAAEKGSVGKILLVM